MIKSSFDATYYHGTFLKTAVDALQSGEPLLPLRPKGSSRHARSDAGAVYLTPSFNQAVEYAYMRDRTDWPDICHSETTPPHVFAFRIIDAMVRPEEDELGYAVKVALHTRLNQRTHWNMNSEFAQKIHDSKDVQEELVDLALSQKFKQYWIDCPATIKGHDRTKIGLKLLPLMPQSLEQRVLEMGISIATIHELRPITGYKINPGSRTFENMSEISLTLDDNEPNALRM